MSNTEKMRGTLTTEEIEKFFEEHEDDFLAFDKVENRKSNRADLHAFLLLDTLVPGTSDVVSSAEHDEIYLDVELEQLSGKITGDQLLELIRCGIRCDDSYLCMFV